MEASAPPGRLSGRWQLDNDEARGGEVMATRDKRPKKVRRAVYPKPEHRFSKAKIGMTYRDSVADFPPMDKAPRHAPNVVVVLLDDVGYGWPSACGGLVRMPAADRLARHGLTY